MGTAVQIKGATIVVGRRTINARNIVSVEHDIEVSQEEAKSIRTFLPSSLKFHAGVALSTIFFVALAFATGWSVAWLIGGLSGVLLVLGFYETSKAASNYPLQSDRHVLKLTLAAGDHAHIVCDGSEDAANMRAQLEAAIGA